MKQEVMPWLWSRARDDGMRARVPVTVRRRVHWGDTDSAQIGYTSALVDFSVEATQYWWEAVLDQNWWRMSEALDLNTPMVGMNFDFIGPVRAGDRVDLAIFVEKLGRASLTLRVEARHVERDEAVFTATLSSALISRATMRATPYPDVWRARIEGYTRECELRGQGVRSIDEVLDFWLGPPAGEEWGEPQLRWFGKDENLDPADFDQEIRARFLATHEAIHRGDLGHWTETPDGALATLLVLDQFSRHIFRGTPAAWASDARARVVAGRVIDAGGHESFPRAARSFFFLPFEHSEDLADQERSLALFGAQRGSEAGERQYEFALRHHEIIARFGRFPHRNEILGRASTPEELAFMEEPNSSF